MEEPVKKPVKKTRELDPRFVDYKHIWVVIENERGVVHPVSWELLGEGRKLADQLGVQLCAVVMTGLGAHGRQTGLIDKYGRWVIFFDNFTNGAK